MSAGIFGIKPHPGCRDAHPGYACCTKRIYASGEGPEKLSSGSSLFSLAQPQLKPTLGGLDTPFGKQDEAGECFE